MSPALIALCGAVYCLAAFVQRVSGFGMGIVAIMILPYFTGSHAHCAAYTSILSSIGALTVTLRFRRSTRWNLIAPILCGSFLTTFLSVRYLSTASFAVLEKVLGVILCLLSVYFMFLKKKILVRPRADKGFLFGAAGGFLNGLFSTGGPPVVMYLLGATEDHDVYFATIQGYFLFNNFYATAVRILNGRLTPDMLPGLLGAVPGLFLGFYLGGRLVPYIREETFLRIIYTVMAASGIMMLL